MVYICLFNYNFALVLFENKIAIMFFVISVVPIQKVSKNLGMGWFYSNQEFIGYANSYDQILCGVSICNIK